MWGAPGWARLTREHPARPGNARHVEMLQLLVGVFQLGVLELHAVLQDFELSFQLALVIQPCLLLIVILQLNLLHVLSVLTDQSRAILAALVVVPGHPHVLRRQNADVALGHGHSVSQHV